MRLGWLWRARDYLVSVTREPGPSSSRTRGTGRAGAWLRRRERFLKRPRPLVVPVLAAERRAVLLARHAPACLLSQFPVHPERLALVAHPGGVDRPL